MPLGRLVARRDLLEKVTKAIKDAEKNGVRDPLGKLKDVLKAGVRHKESKPPKR
jgi:hypothetical protein